MGCGGSSEKGKRSPDGSVNSSGGSERRPKISIRIGPQVKKLEVAASVIFIFGGPGSRKGRIVDDLVNSYNFNFISGEDVIFSELPKKLSNVIKLNDTRDVIETIKEDPSHLTAEWLLECIERQIENDGRPNKTYLVDFIPNLKHFLRASLAEECAAAMEKFEQKFPVSFALNLAVPPDKVLANQKAVCATPGGGEKMKETGGQGDEADASRTQKRATLYDSTVKPFLDFFTKTDRLVTVDVTCGIADLIWNRVNELLRDLDYHPRRSVNTVLLFVTEDGQSEGVDYGKFCMDKIELKAIVDDPMDSADKLLKSLCQHIDNKSRKHHSFVVELVGTSLAGQGTQQIHTKSVKFLELERSFIENYLTMTPYKLTPKAGAKSYKAVCTTENEVCLFTPDTDNIVVIGIAERMASARCI